MQLSPPLGEKNRDCPVVCCLSDVGHVMYTRKLAFSLFIDYAYIMHMGPKRKLKPKNNKNNDNKTILISKENELRSFSLTYLQ